MQMRKSMKKFTALFSGTIAFLFLSLTAMAQHPVSGKLTDKDGNPAIGVTVQVKGTTIATKTANDGTYKINAPSANGQLIFTSAEFGQSQESINGRAVVDVTGLIKKTEELAVVVAYGTRKKSDLTGAVTAVSAKDFQKGNIASSEQLLQGKVPGLQIVSGGGFAGGGSKIRIRGGTSLTASNDPLIVIDGIPVEGNGIGKAENVLNTINPDDIESMSILKDASATALYGSRAANGVIIVTTKKGARGKVKLNFNTKVSVGTVPKYVDVLTGDEVREIVNANAVATGDNKFKALLGEENTNWQKLIYQSAMGYDNNLSASGTIEKVLPFRASVGYLNQEGVLKTDKFKRFTSSLNLNPKLLDDHLSINVALKYANTNTRKANDGAVGTSISFDPTQSVTSSSTKYGGYYEWLNTDGTPKSVGRNPLAMLNYVNNTFDVNRFIGNAQLDYKLHFFPDLHVLFNVGVDATHVTGNDRTDSTFAGSYIDKGYFKENQEKKRNTLTDIQLFYAKDIPSIKTRVDVLVGHGYQEFITNTFNYYAFNQKGDTLDKANKPKPNDKPQFNMESYLGRINLTVNNKYLLTASLRRDASSKFSKENRVGYFPALAVAWKLRDEFFRNTPAVSDLKLRFGWGITGQQDGIGNYEYLARYVNAPRVYYQFGDEYVANVRPARYDPNLTWETTTTTNLGLDFNFLRNRISGSIDFYTKKTKDLLFEVDVAAGSNFSNRLLTNIAKLENKGLEFILNTIPVQTDNFSWNLGGNISYNKAKVITLNNLPGDTKPVLIGGIGIGGGFIGVLKPEYAPNSYNVFQQVYDPATGKPLEGVLDDGDRSGNLGEEDKKIYKKPAPDVLLGFNTSVDYKKWSLGFAGHGSIGNYLYNQYRADNSSIVSLLNTQYTTIGNTYAKYRDADFLNPTRDQKLSDYFIENASFFRLDNINLGYNVGKINNGKATLRTMFSVQNVFVITKYKGLDPEISSNEGIDNNIYPRPRVYTLGLSLDF